MSLCGVAFARHLPLTYQLHLSAGQSVTPAPPANPIPFLLAAEAFTILVMAPSFLPKDLLSGVHLFHRVLLARVSHSVEESP